MTVTTMAAKSEWIVSSISGTSVCVNVKDGEVKSVKIVGLNRDPIFIKDYYLSRLQSLREAIDDVLKEVPNAKKRTGEE